MADSNAVLAALLQGQRQAVDPLQGQRKFGQDLIVKSSSTAPLGSGNPLEGLARALQGGIGGLMAGYADQQEKQRGQDTVEGLSTLAQARTPEETQAAYAKLKGADPNLLAPLLAQIVGQKQQDERTAELGRRSYEAAGGRAAPPTVQTASANPMAVPNTNANAIAGIESQGQPNNGYGALGPPADAKGSRAHGRYQVMDYNIGPWTQEVLGRAMTPQEFLASPEAQDKVFEAKFGQYVSQHGSPQAASRAWFAGQGGMNNPNARDVNGMTPQRYEQQFSANLGQPQGAPQQPPQQAPQVAQAQPPQQAPQVPQSNFDPGARMEQLAQQAARVGDFQSATKYQLQAQEERTKFENARQAQVQNIAVTGAEHDRQQAGTPMNNEQSLSAGFADRMTNSEALIRQFAPALTNFGAKAKDTLPFGLGNLAQSPQYQQAKQARDDFINAQLRRESGAAIAPSEYNNADRQYFPQPGDSPEVIAQKERNRQLAIEGMVRNAGRTYKPSPSVNAAAVSGTAPQGNTPPQPAIERLKANPAEAAQFDEIFGPGSAARVLGR